MIYKIIEEGNDALKIRKKEFKGHSDPEWEPPKDERLGKIFSNGRGKKDVDDFLEVDGKNMPIFDEDNPKERFFQKKAGWIKTNGGYVKVLQTRKSAVAAVIAAILAAILLVLSLLLGVAPKDLPKYLADQAGITHNNANQKVSIEYATYLSTENTTWKAGAKEQDITLALPKETSYKGKNGKTQTAENPVVAAPSVWVDLNKDGKLSSKECLFNKPKYDENGNVIDPGELLKPGNEIRHIRITKALSKGKYNAQTLWTPQIKKGGGPANPMTFKWELKVK